MKKSDPPPIMVFGIISSCMPCNPLCTLSIIYAIVLKSNDAIFIRK